MTASEGSDTAPAPAVQPVLPQLAYRDIGAAVDWLSRAFGFRERAEARFTGPDGRVGHAEMQAGSFVFMLGGDGGHGLTSPAGSGGPSQMLCVYVDDVAAHLERARSAGAVIQAELEDKFWGDRTYEALDLEGHVWAFHQRVRVVAPEEWTVPNG